MKSTILVKEEIVVLQDSMKLCLFPLLKYDKYINSFSYRAELQNSFSVRELNGREVKEGEYRSYRLLSE